MMAKRVRRAPTDKEMRILHVRLTEQAFKDIDSLLSIGWKDRSEFVRSAIRHFIDTYKKEDGN